MTRSPAWWSCAGSSPLARGPPGFLDWFNGTLGLIPARAGTTYRCDRVPQGWRAHPRSRGDHFIKNFNNLAGTGSSPLARGPPTKPAKRLGESGLIPARAGTTRLRYRWYLPGRAHPRSRGDHSSELNRLSAVTGSSPLARGPPFGKVKHYTPPGLIPARAGTTTSPIFSPPLDGAHPRSRGDHE